MSRRRPLTPATQCSRPPLLLDFMEQQRQEIPLAPSMTPCKGWLQEQDWPTGLVIRWAELQTRCTHLLPT